MPVNIFKNLANLVVLFRSLLVFIIILLLSANHVVLRILGVILLLVIAMLDWFDGYLARKFNITSKLGGLMDTLGDRITENIFLIFFAYTHLIPVIVPIVFVARSFCSDFIRSISYQNGISTFAINKSKLGKIFVSSRMSRVVYLVFKIAIFSLASIEMALELLLNVGSPYLLVLKQVIYHGAVLLLLFNLLRFFLLVYDSRIILKEAFTNAN